MTWEEVRAEYSAEGIGLTILAALRKLCGQIARRYPPTIYASSPSWDESAIEELVQDVTVERLLGEAQLDYIMLTAHSLPEFERLMNHQIKRCLSRRRRRTIADNLIDRSRRVLAGAPFQEVKGVSPTRYQVAGRLVEVRDPSMAELRSAAIAGRAVPRDAAGVSRERAPRIYTNDALTAVLESVAATLPTSFSVRDLEEIFRLLLTDLIPSDLEETGAEEEAQPAALGDPAAAMVLRSVVENMVGRLTDEQRVILRMKAADVADGEVATVVGVSRPTLAARKHEIFEVIRAETSDLDDGQREQAVSLALQELARRAAR